MFTLFLVIYPSSIKDIYFTSHIMEVCENMLRHQSSSDQDDAEAQSPHHLYIHYTPVQVVKLVLLSVLFLSRSLIFLTQAFEWVAMKYLIDSQMGRSIGEIVYDYNHQALTSSTDSRDTTVNQCVNYRKRELKMKRWFLRLAFVYIPVISIFYLFLIELDDTILFVYMGMYGLVVIVESFYFISIYLKMKRRHALEFERCRKMLRLQFVITMLMHTIMYFYFYSTTKNWGLSLLSGRQEICNWKFPEEMSFKAWVLCICTFVTNDLNLPFILISIIIVKVKSSSDILQGINKLDYFLAVSVFQIQKGYPDDGGALTEDRDTLADDELL